MKSLITIIAVLFTTISFGQNGMTEYKFSTVEKVNQKTTEKTVVEIESGTAKFYISGNNIKLNITIILTPQIRSKS